MPPAFLVPSGIPCPYLTAKKMGAGVAHLLLSMAPVVEAPSRVGAHFPPKLFSPSVLCPYLAGKDQ